MDKDINSSNRDLYIDAIKTILLPSGILKNFKNILANAVVLAYNVDGVQGKSALKDLKNFYGVLLDAITVEAETGSAEIQLRKALQLQKKRHFKNISNNNNNKIIDNNNS
ncbi:uncharacterized protein LOC121405108 [Drosophila obscura]|uniref:uncharacterized protein LOC121405108 n=1 Tax=Drosophila obscura TaxID=7282 RepID=UPI001BB1BDFE|nr:uncharacterized protein LOC121405108 [Drosophila obscura]